MNQIINPLTGIPDEYLSATSGSEFAVAYGWEDDVEDLIPSLVTMMDLCWDTAKAIGKSEGMLEVDAELRRQLVEGSDRESKMREKEEEDARIIYDLKARGRELLESSNQQRDRLTEEIKRIATVVMDQRDQIRGLEAQIEGFEAKAQRTWRYQALSRLRSWADRQMRGVGEPE